MNQKSFLRDGSGRDICGFTLIEVAISMMILGVIMASALSAYQVYKQKQEITKTTEVVQTVNQALQTFKSNFGRYPCPAPILEPRNSARYGREVRCDGTPMPVQPTAPTLTQIPALPAQPTLANNNTFSGFPSDMTCMATLSTSYPNHPKYCLINVNNLNRYMNLGLSTVAVTNVNQFLAQSASLTTNCGLIIAFGQPVGMMCDYAPLLAAVTAKNADLQAQYAIDNANYQADLAAYNAAIASGVAGDPATNLTPGQCLSGGTPASPTANGVCVEQSDRGGLPYSSKVRVGAIPFRDMQLDEKDTLDGYGNRLVYAVTQGMANADTFKEDGGGIRIIDANGDNLSSGAQSAAYVVFSAGRNGNGAVSANGIAAACNPIGGDSENCRNYSFGAAAPGDNTNATYRMDVTGNAYDDMMAYFVASENPVWRRTAPTAESVTDLTRGNVGVGISDPTQITDTLTVGQSSVNYTDDSAQYGRLANVNGNVAFQTGSLRVGDGSTANNKIFAPQYCDQNGANCFRVENIAAPYDPAQPGHGMGGCPAGQYMTGIEGGAPKCAPIRFYCTNPDEVFIGFNADGTPNCALPNNSCAQGTGSICGVDYVLPMTGHNATKLLINPVQSNNSCAKKTYMCNNGTWQVKTGPGFPASDYDSAHCNYVDSTARATILSRTVSCSETMGQGYTGNATKNYYLGCGGAQIDTNDPPNNSQCVCHPVYEPTEYSCSGNLSASGTIHTIRYKLCDRNNRLDSEWSYQPWQVGGTVSPDGQSIIGGTLVSNNPRSGQDEDERDVRGNRNDPANACRCNIQDKIEFASCDGGGTRKSNPDAYTEQVGTSPSVPIVWPDDTSKGKYRYLQANLNQCNYNPPAWKDNNCTKMEESDPDCAVGCYKTETKKKVRKIRSDSSWIDDPDRSGNTDGTCVARKYKWKASSVRLNSGSGQFNNSNGYPLPNTSCTCAESTNPNPSSCLVQRQANYIFFSCRCLEAN